MTIRSEMHDIYHVNPKVALIAVAFKRNLQAGKVTRHKPLLLPAKVGIKKSLQEKHDKSFKMQY